MWLAIYLIIVVFVLLTALPAIFKVVFVGITGSIAYWVAIRLRNEAHRVTDEGERLQKERQDLIDRCKAMSVEEVILSGLDDELKTDILAKQGYSRSEVWQLCKTAEKSQEKAKLSWAKKKIQRKTFELINKLPSDDKRAPIAEEVREFVWRRDNGKCVKCGSQEKLEFDHIIPFSKGGSDTARNIQLLCEQCNRSKGASI